MRIVGFLSLDLELLDCNGNSLELDEQVALVAVNELLGCAAICIFSDHKGASVVFSDNAINV